MDARITPFSSSIYSAGMYTSETSHMHLFSTMHYVIKTSSATRTIMLQKQTKENNSINSIFQYSENTLFTYEIPT